MHLCALPMWPQLLQSERHLSDIKTDLQQLTPDELLQAEFTLEKAANCILYASRSGCLYGTVKLTVEPHQGLTRKGHQLLACHLYGKEALIASSKENNCNYKKKLCFCWKKWKRCLYSSLPVVVTVAALPGAVRGSTADSIREHSVLLASHPCRSKTWAAW